MVDVGDPLPDLGVQIRDASGALASAGAVTVTIKLPDLTTVTPGVSEPTTGTYEATYFTTQAGRHVAEWVATGINGSAYSQQWYVNPADPGGIVSVSDVKQFLGITSTVDDEELRDWIAAATEMVENEVGPVIVTTRTDVVSGYGELWLPVSPVVSITSAVPQRGGTGLVVGDLSVDPYGRLYRTSGAAIGYAGPWVVTYVVGRTVIPRGITRAVLVIVGHLWELQRGPVDLALSGDSETFPVGAGYAIPNRARELLAPWRRIPSVA